MLFAFLLVAPGQGGNPDLPGDGGELGPVLPVLAAGTTISLGGLPDSVDEAAITDIEAFYFDDDQLRDLAVAWYANDPATPSIRRRYLNIYRGLGQQFDLVAEIDLYRPSTFPPPLDDAVFDNGTGEVVIGDFDGDGDQDVAVLPYFSAEVWFIENLGDGAYQTHFKYIFGQFGGGFLTPPEGAAADFDQDGRDDLVYVVNPTPNASGQLHFWRTSGSIAGMQRIPWEGIEGGVAVTDTLGLAVGDYNGDDRPDVAFTARQQLAETPAVVVWYDLDPSTYEFSVALVYPNHFSADIVAVSQQACLEDLVIDDRLRGRYVELWTGDCQGGFYSSDGRTNGLAGTAQDFGLAMATADMNGDGTLDVVCRQRRATAAIADQVEIVLWDGYEDRFVVDSAAINTAGRENLPGNQILRPRNLVACDLFGDEKPEIVAGFVAKVVAGTQPTLDVVIYSNGCVGDLDGSGTVGLSDLTIMLYDFGNPARDLNRNGIPGDLGDVGLVLGNFGCVAVRPD